jgi:large repetitive protein
VNNNQIYNPTTKVWTIGAAIPTPVYGAASATVSGLFYVIGGYEGASATPSNLVQIYNPAKNTWTTGGAMPTARGSSAAAVDANAIYVIGGNGATLRLNNVEKYVPATNTWTEEAPLLLGKSEPAAGLLGTMIVAADGHGASGDTGDNEAYNVSGNTWSSLTANPNPRNASCYGVLTGQLQLYVAGGLNNGNPQAATAVNESFSVSTHKWTTQRAMPTAAVWPASAVGNGQLYCIGGQASFQGAVVGKVQIYQP